MLLTSIKSSHSHRNIEKDDNIKKKQINQFDKWNDEDWSMPIAFNKQRHVANIEGINCLTQSWRMKERVISHFYYLKY